MTSFFYAIVEALREYLSVSNHLFRFGINLTTEFIIVMIIECDS